MVPSFFGYLVGVAWRLLSAERVLRAFGRFVAFPPLQFHPGLFCYEERGSRRYLFGSWGRLAPCLRAVEVRRGKDLTLHLKAPPANALLPIPERPPYAMLAPALAERLLLDSHCPWFFHALAQPAVLGLAATGHLAQVYPLRIFGEAVSLPQFTIIAVTLLEHLPGTKPVPAVYIQGLLTSLRHSGDVDMSPRDLTGLAAGPRAGEQRAGMQSLFCGTPEPGLSRHCAEQVS